MLGGEGVPRADGKLIGVFADRGVPLSALLQVTVALPLASVDTSDTTTAVFTGEEGAVVTAEAPSSGPSAESGTHAFRETRSAIVWAVSLTLTAIDNPFPSSTPPT